MKPRICILLVSYLCLQGHSDSFGQGRFALSGSFAPVYSQANASAILPMYDPANPVYATLQSNSIRYHYSLGLMARYSFSAKWSISAGIWASHAFAGRDRIRRDTTFFLNRYTYTRPFHNRYKAPLLVNFRPTARRISPYLSAGVTFDFRGKTYVNLNGRSTEFPVKFGKPVVVTPLLGVGAIMDLKKNLSLVVLPTIQYDVQSLSGYQYRHLYQLSLQTQLMYRF